MSSLTSASLMSKAWASVLMAMNSTPFSPASIILFTALTPPPSDPDDLDHGYVVLRWSGHRTSLTARRHKKRPPMLAVPERWT